MVLTLHGMECVPKYSYAVGLCLSTVRSLFLPVIAGFGVFKAQLGI